MKRIVYSLFIFIMPCLLSSKQINILNAEQFTIGTTLKFQICNANGVEPGAEGENQTWDFSNLSLVNDTLTEWMVDPAETPYHNDFPGANLVEKYSDGRYVYVFQSENESHLLGFVDTDQNLVINYPDSVLFCSRPLVYTKTVEAPFTDNFTVNSYSFSGSGTSTLTADGYGTLILPNGTTNDVIRLKIVQEQNDTLLQFGSISKTTSITYAWFDGVHTSALLKIDSSHSDTFTDKSVSYLVSETTSGINDEVPIGFSVYPNPAINKINIHLPHSGLVKIVNEQGKTIQTFHAFTEDAGLNIEKFAQGIYFIIYEYQNQVEVRKFIVRH